MAYSSRPVPGPNARAVRDWPDISPVPDRRHNLPGLLTRLIGRQSDLAQVEQRLADHRLVTLTGPGGVGKTRLALEAAARLTDRFAGGVRFVDLGALTEPALVPLAVAGSLRMHQETDRPVPVALVAMLRPLELLLVLDNCEHVLAACGELVAALLGACPRLRILTTSREPLSVDGEVIWRVQPLAVPGLEGNAAETAGDAEAVRLFLDRARAVQPDLQVTGAGLQAVAQICRQLDGLPLAIELAAAWAGVLPPAQIAHRLADRFRLLHRGKRNAPLRHRTLQAAVDWSHDLLSEPERVLWRRLSVFCGGFTLAAAEAVCGHDRLQPAGILDLLSGLVHKSLVLAVDQEDGGRYRLLETIRQYGAARLAAAGEEPATRRRHLDWCLTLAERAEQEWEGPAQAAWLERLDRDHDNLRGALEWAQTADPEGGLRLGAALRGFWFVRGHLGEGRRHLTHLLRLAPGRSAARARAAEGAGTLAFWQGDYAVARGLYEESLGLCRELGDQPGVGRSLNLLGNVARHLGDYEASRRLCAESLALARGRADRGSIATALTNLASVTALQGEYAQARAMYAESLGLHRELGDKAGAARVLNNLGALDTHRGDFAAAGGHYRESLDLSRELGDKRGCVLTLNNLGLVAAYQADYGRAAGLLQESLALARELGDRRDIAISLYNTGFVCTCQGQYGQAHGPLARSLALRRALQDRWGMAWSLEGMAMVAVGQGQAGRGARLFGAAAALRERLNSPLPPAERAEYDRHVAAAAGALGQAAFQAAWDLGRTLSPAAAAAYALGEQDLTPAPAVAAARKARAGPAAGPAGVLTGRQLEIAGLVAAGLSNREIAARLFLSQRTVDAHMRQIFDRLGVPSRAGLAAWAARNGLMDGQ